VNLDIHDLGHFMITHFNIIIRSLMTDPTYEDETTWLANRLSLFFCYCADYSHFIQSFRSQYNDTLFLLFSVFYYEEVVCALLRIDMKLSMLS
jgi:hypothetical protein